MTALDQHYTEHTKNDEAAHRLSALDRCDSCGAQAYVRVLLNGSDLLFCAHHAHRHESQLRPIADVWHDESHRLHA